MSDPDILAALRKQQPDATEREAQLFAHLWRVWPYLPPNLIDLASGTEVASVVNEWIHDTYGLRFTFPDDEKRRAKMPTKVKA